jgi:carbamoyltransferase|tara:strand:- start:6437 stop:8173 length:1737 start_codon:yes stop_codon:yes gene_type:complete
MNKIKIIIGINANHADSSACILVDGKIIAAIEEERINRKKHFSGFPIESIKECLKIANKKDIEITDIAFNTKPSSNFISKALFLLKNFSFKKNYFIKRINNKINIKKKLFEQFTFNNEIKFHYIDHHLAHIASAFYPSEFFEANGLSIDGSGDFTTLAISECQNNKIKIVEKINFPNSLGIFYHAMTQFLGFKNYGDEYKVMGLAAYGSPKYFQKIKDNLFIDNNKLTYELNLKYFNHHKNDFKYIADDTLSIGQIYNSKLSELFFLELKDTRNKEQFTKDFASSVQKIYEFFFKKIINKIITKKFSKNLVFAGGCALNSSANRFITNTNTLFDNIYIPFAPGDNGGALGAAYIVSSKYNNNVKNSHNPYLGKSFSNDEVLNILKSEIYINKINFKIIKNDNELFDLAAKLISNGNVIGWFQDKMEFGPRALGNRSILADPRNPDMKSIINMKIKRRESFRPFAPSVLKDYQTEWFESSFSSNYMSSLAHVKSDKQNLIPAVTHIDGTARFQTVDSNNNPKYAGLIENFYKLTGVPILLNTSFNENEPIVMNPNEAIDCLLRTDMDALFINNFLINKN